VKALIAGYKTLAKAICVQAILGCEPSAAPTSQTPPPPKASLVRVKSERVVKTFRLEGRLAAFRDVVLYAKLKGTIESVAVAPGARVEAGAVLAMLTSPSIAERRESAEAALQQQVASHQRLLDAAKDRGPVDPALLAEAARKVDLLRTRRNVLLKEEAQLRVTAPFPGVIAECHVQRGHDVEPAAGPRPTPLFRLQEDIKLRLVLNVPEQALGGVVLELEGDLRGPGNVQEIEKVLAIESHRQRWTLVGGFDGLSRFPELGVLRRDLDAAGVESAPGPGERQVLQSGV